MVGYSKMRFVNHWDEPVMKKILVCFWIREKEWRIKKLAKDNMKEVWIGGCLDRSCRTIWRSEAVAYKLSARKLHREHGLITGFPFKKIWRYSNRKIVLHSQSPGQIYYCGYLDLYSRSAVWKRNIDLQTSLWKYAVPQKNGTTWFSVAIDQVIVFNKTERHGHLEIPA